MQAPLKSLEISRASMAPPLLYRSRAHFKRTVSVLFRFCRIAIDLSLGDQSVLPPFRQGGTQAGPAVQDGRFRGGPSPRPPQPPLFGGGRLRVTFLRHSNGRS